MKKIILTILTIARYRLYADDEYDVGSVVVSL